METRRCRLTGSPVLRDPVAAALWRARVGITPVPPEILQEPIDVTRARAIANELYDAIESAGHLRDGWKLVPFLLPVDPGFNPGGTDAVTGESWGVGAPFSGPIYRAFCLESPCTIHLRDLLAPIAELEVGIALENGRVVGAMACVEIDDCRWPDWKHGFPALIADFLAQGVMVYSETVVPAAELGSGMSVRATLTHDGTVVGECELSVADAMHRATTVLPERAVPGRARMATGAVMNAPPLRPGSWHADFGLLGSIDMVVAE
jgi:hypothetical protein